MKNILLAAFSMLAISFAAMAQRTPLTALTNRNITIATQPNAAIWIDEIARGKTDASGKLTAKHLPAGIRKLRIRAKGYKEVVQNIAAAQNGEIKVSLIKTADPAELAFQDADAEKDKQKAADLYEKAIMLRPKFVEAQIALARILAELDLTDEAFQAISNARKARPGIAEASAIEGRLYKSIGEEAKAIASFKRAIKEGGNFQPEANSGLGLLYKEKAEGAGGSGDYDGEAANYKTAAGYFIAAIKQLGVTQDAEVIYQELGAVYEKLEDKKQAIAVYEEFLKVFPNSVSASAVQSFIIQLKKAQ